MEDDVEVETALPRWFYRHVSTKLTLDSIHILGKRNISSGTYV